MKKVILMLIVMVAFLGANAQKKTMVKQADLPKAITENVTKDFAGYTIESSFKVEPKEGGNFTYELIVKKDNGRLILSYDKDGKFVKKTEVRQPKTDAQKPGVKEEPKKDAKKDAPKEAPKPEAPKK